MAREDAPKRGGSSKAPSEKKDDLVHVEAQVVDDDGTGEPVSVVEREDGEAVEGEDDGPVTLGELADGAKGMVGELGTQVKRLVNRGRYRKLRISRKGKQLCPDIPLAAVAAVEAASMYGAGIARILAVNVGAKFLFDVEVVNDADGYYKRGKAAVLDGDLERAAEALEKTDPNRRHPRGRVPAARRVVPLEGRPRACDRHAPAREGARRERGHRSPRRGNLARARGPQRALSRGGYAAQVRAGVTASGPGERQGAWRAT